MKPLLLLLLLCSSSFAQMQMSVSATSVTVKITPGAPNLNVFAVQGHNITDMPSLLGSETDYTLTGSGTYLVIAVNPASRERSALVVTIGGPSPGPGPDPTPVPPPKPDVVIDNSYNVGSIAYAKAPKEPTVAKTIAMLYRKNAIRLYGDTSQGIGLATIQEIDIDIAKQFDALRLSPQWVDWKVAVNAAQTAEQTRRRTFTRDDWYAFFTEIIKALEKV